MTEAFEDIFPHLSKTIDVGGDLYYMAANRTVEIGFKGHDKFLETFGKEKYSKFDIDRIEWLFRTYLPYTFRDKTEKSFKIKEDGDKYKNIPINDKNDLLAILTIRLEQLKMSNEFTSYVVKNTMFQRIYLGLLQLIQLIKGSPGEAMKEKSAQCLKNIDTIQGMNRSEKMKLIIEFAWYLLNPDKIPEDIQCEWVALVSELQKLRLSHLERIPVRGGGEEKLPTINLDAIAASSSVNNAVKTITTPSELEQIKERLRSILEVLEMKKYLSQPVQNTAVVVKDLQNSLISNPLSDEKEKKANKKINKLLGQVMQPLFDYFKNMYDPIYSILNPSESPLPHAPLPHLLTLLHICNQLHTKVEYGVYRIINLDADLFAFVQSKLADINQYIIDFKEDNDKKQEFKNQSNALPKIRLSSFVNTTNNATKKITASVQFFIIGDTGKANLTRSKDVKEEVKKDAADFFKEGSLYLTYNVLEKDIPMKAFDIDYNSVDVTKNELEVSPLSTLFQGEPVLFNDVMTPDPYCVYNEAGLAMSIFIALKEHMPK